MGIIEMLIDIVVCTVLVIAEKVDDLICWITGKPPYRPGDE